MLRLERITCLTLVVAVAVNTITFVLRVIREWTSEMCANSIQKSVPLHRIDYTLFRATITSNKSHKQSFSPNDLPLFHTVCLVDNEGNKILLVHLTSELLPPSEICQHCLQTNKYQLVITSENAFLHPLIIATDRCTFHSPTQKLGHLRLFNGETTITIL